APRGTGVGIGTVESIEVVDDDRVIATVLPPAGWDADGTQFDVSYEVQGTRLLVRFPHRDGDLHYPLFVDPDFTQQWGSGGSTWPWPTQTGGWSWESGGAFGSSVSSGYLLITNAVNSYFAANATGQYRWTPATGFAVT